ncbi:MAG: DUF4097 family beta strand repeat-containing protein [Candidatus Izimaplasma sp.]|nr:DUF4097 family beta strand repeat-containing protein [Candidatus Izimaplasma bacterium]
MKKFLKDLEKELIDLNMNDSEIKEILKDHQEMIDEAFSEGLSDENVEKKFGEPKKVAKELFNDQRQEINTTNYAKKMGSGKTRKYNLLESYDIDESLTEINIALISEDVKIYLTDSETLDVYFRKVSDLKSYDISFKNGIFNLSKNKTINILRFASLKTPKFIIELPKATVLNKFNYKTVSGDVELTGIETNELVLKTTSGDFLLNGIKFQEGKINSVSGDFEGSDVVGETLKLTLVSGDYELDNFHLSSKFDVSTVSGDVELTDSEVGETNFHSVSGDLEGKEFYPTKIDMKTVSGDVEIYNRDKKKTIEIGRRKTISGDIEIR